MRRALKFNLFALGATMTLGVVQLTSDDLNNSCVSFNIEEEHLTASGNVSDLLGTNIAVWDYPTRYNIPKVTEFLKAWNPGLIRIPGGSWSDAYYWNGNGVTQSKKVKLGDFFQTDRWVDNRRFQNGKWLVDYSDYAPGFAVKSDLSADVFHGNFDAKELHNYLETVGGSSAVVTVNAGTGTAECAAEWVAWCKKMNYKVAYWEVGNELEGSWEPGHFLPDGSKMTGPIYAQRFAEFAKAMKKANPLAKIGGATSGSHAGGFTEDMLKLSGPYVDFVSFHHYPTGESLVSDQELFGKIDELESIVNKYRGWIKTYCPTRYQNIKLGISEWNLKLPEDHQTGDMTSALWSSLFIAEMLKTGVNFANQWDLFTQKENGGHGALHFNGQIVQAKSQYWAFWLWSQHMGNTVVKFNASQSKSTLRIIPTLRDQDLCVMVVNLDRHQPAQVSFKTQKSYHSVESYLLSNQSYLWNDLKKEPEWSTAPIQNIHHHKAAWSFNLPPFSIQVLKFKKETSAPLKASSQEIFPGIQFISPKILPKLKKQNLVVTCRDVGHGQPLALDRVLNLKVLEGKAQLSSNVLRLIDAAIQVEITPLKEGTLIIGGDFGGAPIDPPLHVKVIESRESSSVIWSFEKDHEDGQLSSDWPASRNGNVSPNVFVWDVELSSRRPEPSKDSVLAIQKLSSRIDKENVMGIFCHVMLSKDFHSKDPSASLRWVFQSEGKHWMPMEKMPLQQFKPGSFVKLEAKIPTEWEGLMGGLYQIKLIYDTTHDTQGRIFIDNVGLIFNY